MTSENQDLRDLDQLASGAGVSLGGRLGGRLLQLAMHVVLARVLGPLAFGLFSIGWSVVRVLSYTGTLGLEQGVVRFASPTWGRDLASSRRIVSRAALVVAASAIVLGAVLGLSSGWLATSVFHQDELGAPLAVFAVILPLAILLRFAAAVTTISRRTHYAALVEDLSQPFVALGLLGVLYLWNLTLGGAIAAVALSFVFSLVLGCFFVRLVISRRRPLPERPAQGADSPVSYRKLLSFSLHASLAGMMAYQIFWLDRLILAFFRDAAEVGVYQAVAQLSLLFGVVLGGFNAIFGPIAASLFAEGNTRRVEKVFRASTRWALHLSIPLAVVFCLHPETVLTVLFGEDYAVGSTALVILSLGQLVNVATGSVGLLLVMGDQQRRWVVITAGSLALSILSNLLLVPRLGFLGAAIASAVALATMFTGGLVEVRRSLGLWPYDWRIVKIVVASCLAALAVSAVRLWESGSVTSLLVVVVVTSFLVYAGAVLALGIDPDEREMLRLMQTKFLRQTSR